MEEKSERHENWDQWRIMKEIYKQIKAKLNIRYVMHRLLEDIKCHHIWTASMFTSGNHDYFIRCAKCGCERIEKVK